MDKREVFSNFVKSYAALVEDIENTIDCLGKKNVLIDLIKDAKRSELWDVWYQLTNIGYYTEDKRKLRDFALNVVNNCYHEKPVGSWQETSNREIENAIFNALRKDREEYFDGLEEALELHDVLNPALWENEALRQDVADALLKIANTFVDGLGFPLNVVDIRIVGSNASYNYNEHSDIDLHIISNFELNYVDDAILQQLYNNEKNSFNNHHDITVKGISVELYVEDIKSMNATNGSYSLLTNDWVKFPQPITYEIPDYSVELDRELDKAEAALLSDSSQEIKDEINHIYLMRRDGLASEGEASKGNLVFKELRNLDVIKKLAERFYELESMELSLESENLSEDSKPTPIRSDVVVGLLNDSLRGFNWFVEYAPQNKKKLNIITNKSRQEGKDKIIGTVNISNFNRMVYIHYRGEQLDLNIGEYFDNNDSEYEATCRSIDRTLTDFVARVNKESKKSKDLDIEVPEDDVDNFTGIRQDEDGVYYHYQNGVRGEVASDDDLDEADDYFAKMDKIRDAAMEDIRSSIDNEFSDIKVSQVTTSRYSSPRIQLTCNKKKTFVYWLDYDGPTFIIGDKYNSYSGTKEEVIDYLKSNRDNLFRVVESEKLTEADLLDILNKAKSETPKRVKRSQSLYSEYTGLDSDGTIMFHTDSQTRASHDGHDQFIFYEGFFDLLDKVDAGEHITQEDVLEIITGDVMIRCTCEDFLYGGFAYMSWNNGYGLQKELRAPDVRNPNREGSACKHCLSVLNLINQSNTLFDKIAKDLDNLFQRYKKMAKTKAKNEAKNESQILTEVSELHGDLDPYDLADDLFRLTSDIEVLYDQYDRDHSGDRDRDSIIRSLDDIRDYVVNKFGMLGDTTNKVTEAVGDATPNGVLDSLSNIYKEIEDLYDQEEEVVDDTDRRKHLYAIKKISAFFIKKFNESKKK